MLASSNLDHAGQQRERCIGRLKLVDRPRSAPCRQAARSANGNSGRWTSRGLLMSGLMHRTLSPAHTLTSGTECKNRCHDLQMVKGTIYQAVSMYWDTALHSSGVNTQSLQPCELITKDSSQHRVKQSYCEHNTNVRCPAKDKCPFNYTTQECYAKCMPISITQALQTRLQSSIFSDLRLNPWLLCVVLKDIHHRALEPAGLAAHMI